MPELHSSSNASKPIKEYLAEKGLSVDKSSRLTSGTFVPIRNTSSSLDPTCISYLNQYLGVYSVKSEQSEEVDRQINRLKPYLSCYNNDDQHSIEMRNNITTAIKVMHNFAAGPFPVPMLSLGDSNSTLFIKTDDVYGDIEIKNGVMEYLLEECSEGEKKSYYGEEDIENERLPKKLLVLLYKAFARTK